ncbi:MAG: DUF362 domain-containing protein [Desulfotomaculum sp.]|nr:DUF362 domain-containing protein [Desulfotomaculum sp.]
MHFGQKGNLAYVRPQFTRVLVDRVKELGGKPFLTDANTADKIKALHPDCQYEKSLIHGEALGLGTRKYKLIKL